MEHGERNVNIVQWAFPDEGGYFQQNNLIMDCMEIIRQESQNQIDKKMKKK